MSTVPMSLRAPEPSAGDLIEVRQLPVIVERLREVKESVELTLREATSLACTEETIKDVKAKRAELNKQFSELEESRKAVKKAILKPYEDFEAVYAECISGPFKKADAALKAEISAFEGELKHQCTESLRRFFGEVCAINRVDGLTLEKAMEIGKVKIALSDARAKAPKSLQDSVAMVVCKVAADMERIALMDDAPEIMTEYRRCYDVGEAVSTVSERKRKIEAERKASERRAASLAAQEAVKNKVAASIPSDTSKNATESRQEPERIFPLVRLTLKNITESQVKRLREYLKQEGIVYE